MTNLEPNLDSNASLTLMLTKLLKNIHYNTINYLKE